jgi:hypothetical protein
MRAPAAPRNPAVPAGVQAPNPLQLRTPVPDKFSPDEVKALMPLEAATYAWLFQGIRNL